MEKLTIQLAFSRWEDGEAPNDEGEFVPGKGPKVTKTFQIQETQPKINSKVLLPILAEIEKFVTGRYGE